MITALKKYAVFSGRSSRSEYFCFYLGCIAITLLIYLLGMVLTIIFPQFLEIAILISVWGVSLFFVIPSISVSVRRLHDLNCRGWWFLLSLIPLINILLFIWLLFFRGIKGENRFGPDPC
jgi:uncharacterized membrane protein YhaH (DUF805 family)